MKKTQKGFTLIELLIVIAIIGILAGVILVSTSSAQNKAKYASGISTMRSALTYMVLCTSGGGSLTAYTAGQPICNQTTVTDANWPATPSGCTAGLTAAAGGTTLTATCGGLPISCDATTGKCT